MFKLVIIILALWVPMLVGMSILALVPVSNQSAAQIYLWSWFFEIVWFIYLLAGVAKKGSAIEVYQLVIWPWSTWQERNNGE